MVSLEGQLGSLTPLEPAVAVPRVAESGASGGVAVKRWGMGSATRGRRGARVRSDVVAAPSGVPVDAAGRAMTRPRRTHHEEEDGENGSCRVEPSHVPLGLLDRLQSLPEAERANYGDTKARVKEGAAVLMPLRFG